MGHKGSGLNLMKVPDEIAQYFPTECKTCPYRQSCDSCKVSEIRYDIDIIVETKVVAHQKMACECPQRNNKVILG